MSFSCAFRRKHEVTLRAAYRRGDQFEKRRKLMEAWAAFCEPRADKVVAFERR